MARYPAWFERLDGILSELEGSPERLGRDEVQALFGVGERDSLRLLNRFGARRSGDALALDRGSLLHQLEALRSTDAYRAFRAQRGAVGRAVAAEAGKGREDAPSHPKRHRIHGTANFVPRPRLADLPPGVTLERGDSPWNSPTPRICGMRSINWQTSPPRITRPSNKQPSRGREHPAAFRRRVLGNGGPTHPSRDCG